MKKIININFHSRVIPIEETAYDILGKYVESLKKHFAGEDGGDEIVNDIEDRFAELFSDRLKKGATCITDADVDEIITSMGRPEDFDQDEKAASQTSSGSKPSGTAFSQAEPADEPKRLYRSENDKMLGGICGGLAAYLRIDPSFVRIIFAILVLGSFGTIALIYIVLWVVLPPKSMVTTIKKRLFRDPDRRVVAGVASGLAAYFNIEVWIPRVIFCLPLIAGALATIFRHQWFDFDGPIFFTGGFGGALFTTYIILWIVLPEAFTASEKLEMRGEKIDLESIKNTIKSDLEGFKQKATVVGGEIKQKAEQFGNTMKDKSGGIRRDLSSVNIPRRGVGHAIAVLFKAFFLFISVIVAFALITALIGVMFAGAGVLPLKNYFITGFWHNLMAWGVLILFLILPVVGLLTWLIRRIIGTRSRSNYLGYIFGTLWTIGLICLIFLAASISHHFSTRSGVTDDISIATPRHGKLLVKMDHSNPVFFDSDFMDIDWHHSPFSSVNEDSMMLNTVRINIVKSSDSNWRIHREKLSRGNSSNEARELASQINFQLTQNDSVLLLSPGFTITPKQQFRNQQVLIVIEMPVGQKILLEKNLDDYHWFNINSNNWRNRGVRVDWNDSDDANAWDVDVEYRMTDNGLERTHKLPQTNDDGDDDNDAKPAPDSNNKSKDGEYRYKPKTANASLIRTVVPENAPETEADAAPALVLLTGLS